MFFDLRSICTMMSTHGLRRCRKFGGTREKSTSSKHHRKLLTKHGHAHISFPTPRLDAKYLYLLRSWAPTQISPGKNVAGRQVFYSD